MNDVISLKNSETLFLSLYIILLIFKFIKKKIKRRSDKLKPVENQSGKKEENYFQGYPIYPESEDIFKAKVPKSNNAHRRRDMEEDQLE